jgi:hypothetical protein
MMFSFILKNRLEQQFPQYEWFVGVVEAALRVEVINPVNGRSVHGFLPANLPSANLEEDVNCLGKSLLKSLSKAA